MTRKSCNNHLSTLTRFLKWLNASNQYNWTPAQITEVKNNIQDGLHWWVDTLDGLNSKHSLEFVRRQGVAPTTVRTLVDEVR